MIPKETVEQILDLDIIKVLEDEGLELKKKGADYWACCPFHNEKTPSFKASPATNLWYCFGCHKGGGVVGFIMEHRNMNYPEALQYLAEKNGIRYVQEEMTPEEREAQFLRDQLFLYNRTAHEFFVSKIDVPAARDYIKKRGWDDRGAVDDVGERRLGILEQFGVGYAPNSREFQEYMAAHGCGDTSLMLTAGLIKKDDDTGRTYDTFRNRIMFPIYNDSGNVCGFTGRDVTGEAGAKYLNTADTPVFRKGNVLFGWHQGRRKIAALEMVILCEGNPDVIRLHQIGQNYAVAPLGTALTDRQIETIRRKARRVIIIGDVDAAGIKATEEHGADLIRAGIQDVRVMTLPGDPEDKRKGGVKVDPDEYFASRRHPSEFDNLINTATEDYLPWIAGREMAKAKSEADKVAVISKVAELLSHIDDKVATVYLDQFKGRYKAGPVWTKQYNQAKVAMQRRTEREDGTQDMLAEYGFYVKDNSYFGAGSQGSDRRWSNFTLKPILHIRDEKNARRIYQITNSKGNEAVIKFNQSELVSFTDFKTRVETAGNFIWEATQNELTVLKKYLYDGTPSADEIRQLGWQKKWGFYAWGNGGFDEMNNFVRADKFGIITIKGNKFYLPGYALDTQDNTTGYQQHRRFVYAETSNVTLGEFAAQVGTVFGDNGKVGVCFLLATMFKDVVTGVTTGFPILNLFGPKGTGKSELGHALTSLFVPNNIAPNINNTTKAALGEAVAEVSNAPVHLDEYKNDIDLDKREFLKGLWDGTGRSRMNMDNDKKRETTSVDCGVIMSGQDMALADIALFNRLVFLSFSKTRFDETEKANFDRLRLMTSRGLTHLARQILEFRPYFQATFRQSWDDALADLYAQVRSHEVEDRTLKNWAVVLSAFKCLEPKLALPFDYAEMLRICTAGCIDQNGKTERNNEISGFWEIMESLMASKIIQPRVNYIITSFGKPFRIKESNVEFIPRPTGRYIAVNFKSVAGYYTKESKDTDRKKVPLATLKYYLEHSPEFMGTKPSVRFVVPDSTSGFINPNQEKTFVTTAMLFDYDKIESTYNISLDVGTTPFSEVESGAPASPQAPQVQQPTVFENMDDLPLD